MAIGGLTETAPAKVNLFLHVLGRRPDGYHALDSLAVFAGAADTLMASPSDRLSLTLGGPFGTALADDPDNLVLRAARLLAAAAGVAAEARLHLDKALPVASGIGGGSADAAAALRLLHRLWDLPPELDLGALAARLGADVPVCVASRAARMGGVGDRLGHAPRMPACGLVLLNPGVALPTASVFRERSGSFSDAADLPEGWDDAAVMARDLAKFRNDLEPPAIRLCPVIAEALAVLRATDGCLLARMSGSGATCFGLFPDAEIARARAAAVRHGGGATAGWWCWGGRLLG